MKGWVSIPEWCDKMTTFTINRNNRTIIISKAFEKKASKFGSEEYYALVEAQRDNAGFRVVVKENSRKPKAGSKITLDEMRRYIELRDNEEKTEMAEFEAQLNSKAHKHNFFSVQKWFVEKYPQAV